MSELSIEQLLSLLDADGLANVDPIAFAYVRGLVSRISLDANKAEVGVESVERLEMHAKAREAASNYLDKAEQKRTNAEASLSDLNNADEFVQQQANELYQNYRFTQLERLIERYKNRAKVQTPSPLLEFQTLVASMSQTNEQQELDKPEQGASSIEQLLNKQEQNAKVDSGELDPELQDDLNEQLELRSMKFFRESMKHYNIDKTIARAIFEEPQNPGPLNPHMIAIKGLTKMQELSPDYLRRFAGYLETLLWLEKNLNKLNVTPKANI